MTRSRLQAAAEMKNSFGFGKKDTNTVVKSSVGGQISGVQRA
jgi:hypothetical protein